MCEGGEAGLGGKGGSRGGWLWDGRGLPVLRAEMSNGGLQAWLPDPAFSSAHKSSKLSEWTQQHSEVLIRHFITSMILALLQMHLFAPVASGRSCSFWQLPAVPPHRSTTRSSHCSSRPSSGRRSRRTPVSSGAYPSFCSEP